MFFFPCIHSGHFALMVIKIAMIVVVSSNNLSFLIFQRYGTNLMEYATFTGRGAGGNEFTIIFVAKKQWKIAQQLCLNTYRSGKVFLSVRL